MAVSSLYSDALFLLHRSGISCILWLQDIFSTWKWTMLFISHIGDPANAFLVYFPLLYCLNSDTGLDVLWSAIISEWINLVAKWFLSGERPYWWINEVNDPRKSQIKQFELTCETGPGSPSGHVMVTAAVWLTIALSLNKNLHLISLRKYHFLWRIVLLMLFSLLMTSVALSRLFIATHFPHQVILGLVVAVAIVGFFRRGSLYKNAGMGHFLVVALTLVTVALISYYVLSMFLFNPSTSIEKATKWCAEPGYIHLDTTPFHALVRDAASVLGLGIGLWVQRHLPMQGNNSEKKKKVYFGLQNIIVICRLILRISLIFLIVSALKQITFPCEPFLFYILAFIRWTLIPICVLVCNTLFRGM